MSENNRRWPAAAVAAGLLAVLLGCRGEESIASKSAAAFEEARKEGKTFAGAEHGHSHGAPTPGGEHEGHQMPDAAPGASAAGHQHGASHEAHESPEGGSAADHAAMGHAPNHGAGQHAGHGSPAGARSAAAGHGHAGHSQPAAGGHDHAAPQPAAPDQGHAGHAMPAAGTPSAPVPEMPELPTQPAGILRPDPLDAPAATSVADAQRSAEMNQAMSGGTEGHGGHGAGTYQHIDVGREPGAMQHHDHGPAQPQASLYVCPVHPEVTSKTPGTCPKCGRTLVERREE